MADRPSDLPRWATDPGSRVEPPEGKKDEGWQEGEKPPAGFFNWLFGKLYDWVAWLESVTRPGSPGTLAVYRLNASERVDTIFVQTGHVQATHGGEVPVSAIRTGAGSSPAVSGAIDGPGTGPAIDGLGGSGPGVRGSSIGGPGVEGKGGANAPGVKGEANGEGPGVLGEGSANAPGVLGVSGGGDGVLGTSSMEHAPGVRGINSHHRGFGVHGEGSVGVNGRASPTGIGVQASVDVSSPSARGVALRLVPQKAPTVLDPPVGSLYYDEDTNKLRLRTAGSWVDLN